MYFFGSALCMHNDTPAYFWQLKDAVWIVVLWVSISAYHDPATHQDITLHFNDFQSQSNILSETRCKVPENKLHNIGRQKVM